MGHTRPRRALHVSSLGRTITIIIIIVVVIQDLEHKGPSTTCLVRSPPPPSSSSSSSSSSSLCYFPCFLLGSSASWWIIHTSPVNVAAAAAARTVNDRSPPSRTTPLTTPAPRTDFAISAVCVGRKDENSPRVRASSSGYRSSRRKAREGMAMAAWSSRGIGSLGCGVKKGECGTRNANVAYPNVMTMQVVSDVVRRQCSSSRPLGLCRTR